MIKFFNEVDVNGDGDLTWVEFSNYIIELGKLYNTGLVINNVDQNNKIKFYQLSKSVHDKFKHEN